jgi:hypothetical protein
MTREEITAFFDGVIVEGISREVVFLPQSEEGYIEVSLVAPIQTGMFPIHLSIPVVKRNERKKK